MGVHHPPASLIRFIGKTGFISRELWQDFFYVNRKKEWNRKGWKELTLRGYCKAHPESRIQNVHVLNRSNQLVKDIVRDGAVSAQRGSHLAHDEILYRGILLAERAEIISDWKSEAELKSIGKESFRVASVAGTAKYPDALVYLSKPTPSKPIAIECEMTQKSAKRYGQMMASYAGFNELGAVVFITNSMAVVNAVKRAMSENFYPEKIRPVLFTTTENWQRESLNELKLLSRYRPDAGAQDGQSDASKLCLSY
jgi:hypothetical protein